MLIDDIKIEVSAGHGGKGCVAFNKNLMSLGPAGGSGGHGGSVIFVGVSDLNALNQFRFRKQVNAENGREGKGQFCDGPDAKNEMIKIPVGTVINNLTTGESQEITKVGQEILIAKGGRGGRGNFQFRGSKNTTPKEFEEGKPGQEFELRLELKMIADIGFVGLPNLGKSSLLNELTNANVKVANYQFTTLEPNLGVYNSLILADIPGLIEGASDGKGLGIKFLKHVERTKIIFHFLAADSEDITADYKTIRAELGSFNPTLLEKPEYIVVSRSDTVTPEILKEKLKEAKKINKKAIPISIHDWDEIQKVKNILNELEKEK
ncbi:MAG: GTPase obg [Candidatus Moranbacteria bacterium GW2011_GWC2_37_8]|nr:MAG: GTPase obg [Candidatus Moranbacteria bacterium GW2011_GWC2_37_8]KKQ62836.1 MAG: GTPase ObgE, GTP-binding protein [Parcubacteria group bacterium GW2011_GWC1_38_22]